MILFVCPHCNGTVLVEQLNCQIFRHGILKETGQQINPHLKKSDCDLLFESGRIYGCGKPSNTSVLFCNKTHKVM